MIASWKKHVQHPRDFCDKHFLFLFSSAFCWMREFSLQLRTIPKSIVETPPPMEYMRCIVAIIQHPRFTNKFPVKLIQIVWN